MYLQGHLIVISFLLFCVDAQFGPMKVEIASAALGDEHLYPCLTAINCVYANTSEHQRLRNCLDIMDDTDKKISAKWILFEGEETPTNPDQYEVLEQYYCKRKNQAERKKIFEQVVEGAFDLYALGCANKYDKKTCEHWAFITDCTAEMLDQLNADNMCDISSVENE